MKYRQKSTNTIDKFAVANEVTLEETLAREDDLLLSYSHQSSPPAKKIKSNVCDDVDSSLSSKAPTRNPFCLTKSNTDDSTNLRPLTKTLSPVKKPTTTLSPMKTPTKASSPVKKPYPKVQKRKLATTTMVLSRFFKKPETKVDKETEHVDHIEIKEKFLHVKSLYNNSVNSALSLYADMDATESKTEKQECTNDNDSKSSYEENSIKDNIIEIPSDTEDDQTAIKKTLNKFIHQKGVSES